MAIQQQDTEIDGVINGRTAIAGLLAFAVFLISTLVLFLVRSDAATEVRGNPGTTWLSGETKGRLVMAAAGGSRPSVAVEIGVPGDAYDVVDLGQNVLVHNRVSGEIIVVDGVTGTVAETVEGTRSAPIHAAYWFPPATSAYLVDVAKSTAQRVAGDGTRRRGHDDRPWVHRLGRHG